MADAFIGKDHESKAHDSQNHVNTTSPQKRKALDDVEGDPPVEKKKFAMNFNMKKPADNIKKVSINFGSSQKQNVAPIKMSLPSQKPKETSVTVKPKTAAVAKAFNEDDESDEEEMPPEAKMRMRNIGRDTPTAAGPNSFGKGRLGFCDRQKMVEKEIIKHMEEVGED